MKAGQYLLEFIAKQWAIFVLLGIGIITYINILPNGFVWDDYVDIVNNPDAKQIHLETLFQRNAVNNGLFYRPFALLYTSLLQSSFQDGAFWYHLSQVGIHLVNTVLVYFLFTRFLKRLSALILSVIFLVHPIQVESVAFAASFVGPLSFLFGILAVHFSYMNSKRFFNIVGCSLLLLGSMFVKEQGVLFVPIVIFNVLVFSENNTKRFYIFIGCLISFLIYGYFRLFIGQTGFINTRAGVVPIALLDIDQRLLNVPEVVWYYFRTFLFPYWLAIDQQWVVSKITFWQFWFPLIIVCFIFGLFLWSARTLLHQDKRRFKVFVFFFVWFVITLAFHLPVIPSDMTVADRFFYLPIVGLLGMIGVYLEHVNSIFRRNVYVRRFLLMGSAIMLILLITRTVHRNSNWVDERALYEHDLSIYDSFNIENNLGNIYLSDGRYKDALARFQQSYALFPTELNSFNVGYAYDLQRRPEEAVQHYEKSLTYKKYPDKNNAVIRQMAMEKLIRLYLIEKKYARAQEILKRNPSDLSINGQLWQYFAISEYNLGNTDEAYAALEKSKKYLSSTDASSDYLYSLMQQGEQITLIRSK